MWRTRIYFQSFFFLRCQGEEGRGENRGEKKSRMKDTKEGRARKNEVPEVQGDRERRG